MRQIYSQIAFPIMLAVCAAALRWGGPVERRAAVLIGVGWIATLAAQRLTGTVAPVVLFAVMDVVVFALLLVLSWRDRAGWVIYGLGCQGVALGVHAIRLFSPAMPTWTYVTALAVSSYGLLAALAWGTWLVRRPGPPGFPS